MKYDKPSLSITKQLSKLSDKGLNIDNSSFAKKKLKSVNYYRLSSYFQPFYKRNTKIFKNNTSFEDISKLYDFDEDLRLMIFSCIQKIEIAIRSRIINNYSNNFNTHWFTNRKRFKEFDKFYDHF